MKLSDLAAGQKFTFSDRFFGLTCTYLIPTFDLDSSSYFYYYSCSGCIYGTDEDLEVEKIDEQF